MSNDRRAACLDHVIPYSRGGTNRDKNLVTACKRCNAEKNNKTPSEAGFKWPEGLGEYYDRNTNDVVECTVNPPLTGGPSVPDKEVEREEGKGRGNGKGREVPPTGATPPKFAPEDLSLAETILEGVKTVAPSSRPRLEKWAETVRLMRERDERTHDDILTMFRWANTHSFWRTNILSPEKLREKWTTLEAQQRSPPRGEMKTRQQMADERSRAAVDEFVGSGRIIEGEKA